MILRFSVTHPFQKRQSLVAPLAAIGMMRQMNMILVAMAIMGFAADMLHDPKVLGLKTMGNIQSVGIGL